MHEQRVNVTRPLPEPAEEYSHSHADIMRTSIEQNFDEINTQIARLRDQYDRDAFLIVVENSFLCMGAPGSGGP